jgi:hypothetical protein
MLSTNSLYDTYQRDRGNVIKVITEISNKTLTNSVGQICS